MIDRNKSKIYFEAFLGGVLYEQQLFTNNLSNPSKSLKTALYRKPINLSREM